MRRELNSNKISADYHPFVKLSGDLVSWSANNMINHLSFDLYHVKQL